MAVHFYSWQFMTVYDDSLGFTWVTWVLLVHLGSHGFSWLPFGLTWLHLGWLGITWVHSGVKHNHIPEQNREMKHAQNSLACLLQWEYTMSRISCLVWMDQTYTRWLFVKNIIVFKNNIATWFVGKSRGRGGLKPYDGVIPPPSFLTSWKSLWYFSDG